MLNVERGGGIAQVAEVPAEIVIPPNWCRTTDQPSVFLRVTDGRFATEGITAALRLEISRVIRFEGREDTRLEPVPIEVGVDVSADGNVARIRCRTALDDGDYVISTLAPGGGPERQAGIIVGPAGVDCRATADEVASFLAATRGIRLCANGQGKSGTTWLYRMLGTLPGFSVFPQDTITISGMDPTELALAAENASFHAHLRYDLGTQRELKKHDYRLVQIVRDIRDTIVSEYFHQFVMQEGKAFPQLRDLPKHELLSMDNIRRWSWSYHGGYDAIAWKYCGGWPIVRYEDLLDRPTSVLSAALRAIGIEAAESIVQYAVELNSFAYTTGGRERGVMDPMSPARNGVAGNWREHLPIETVIALDNEYDLYFREFGYSPSGVPRPLWQHSA